MWKRLAIVWLACCLLYAGAHAQLSVTGVGGGFGTGGGGGGGVTFSTTSSATPPGFINGVLSGGNLIFTQTSTSTDGGATSTTNHSTGKFYVKFTLTSQGSLANDTAGGVANSSANLTTSPNSTTGLAVVYTGSGNIWVNGSSPGNIGSAFSTSDTLGVALDQTNGCIYFQRNAGSWNGNVATDPTSVTPCSTGLTVSLSGLTGAKWFAATGTANGGNVWTVDVSGSGAPSGYSPW